MEYISKEGLEKVKEELKKRKTDTREEIAKRLKEAKLLGDLSENSEYDTAKEAQAFNEGKICKLEEVVKKAVLIKPTKNQSQKKRKVQIGSVVKAQIVGSSAGEKVFIVVGSQEADPIQGKISNESPLGMAFLGRQINDIIEVETPKMKMKYKIIHIE